VTACPRLKSADALSSGSEGLLCDEHGDFLAAFFALEHDADFPSISLPIDQAVIIRKIAGEAAKVDPAVHDEDSRHDALLES